MLYATFFDRVQTYGSAVYFTVTCSFVTLLLKWDLT